MTNRKWSNATIDENLTHRNIKRVTNVNEISAPSITKISWLCTVCEELWFTTVDSVLNHKSGCPYCAGNRKMTIKDVQVKVKDRNIIVLELYDGKQNQERKGHFRCGICSNKWKMILSNMLGKKQGCPRCGKSGRYTQTWFDRFPERKTQQGKIYLMCLEDDNETFLKVGITKRDTKTRFTTSVPYKTTTLLEVETTLYEAFKKEQLILHSLKRYVPNKHFGGKNECFDVSLQEEIINEIL